MPSAVGRHFRCLLLCVLMAATPSVGRAQAQTPTPKTQFRVALFPYLPDTLGDKFLSLLARVEREFEAQNQSIDLVLRPLDPNDDFYDSATLSKWLTADPAGGGYAMVEVDTVVLGELIDANLLTPWVTPPGVNNGTQRAGPV